MNLSNSLYRRPLPSPSIAFSSLEGRALFREALESGSAESFFPLIEQFHTQGDPSFCGLGSLVMALNALGIDPGRVWRGPWRWFSEELLDCCTPLDAVRQAGLSLDEVACLARCNGAEVALSRPDTAGLPAFRAAIERTVRGDTSVLIASYSRAALGQTGEGHYSPIGAYHSGRDSVLVLDVARFKYPPHWVPVEALYAATLAVDQVTSQPRGWLELVRRDVPSAIARLLRCDGIAVRGRVQALLSLHAAALEERRPATLAALMEMALRALDESGLLESVRLNSPLGAEQHALLEKLGNELGALPLYQLTAQALGSQRAMAVVIWMFAAPASFVRSLPEPLRAEVEAHREPSGLSEPLARELLLLRSQIEFLLEHARPARHAGAAGASNSELVASGG